MNSMMIRLGHPMVQWLNDSDAGTWFGEMACGVPPQARIAVPHSEDLMDVLSKVWNAERRRDGSVRIEVIGRSEAEALREWAGYIEYFTSQGAGHDAYERGVMNSARALLRALDDYLRRLA